MITGAQIRMARRSLKWVQKDLAAKAKVPLSVVVRAEDSADEPMVTIVQMNALMQALRGAGADFSSAPEGDELGA